MSYTWYISKLIKLDFKFKILPAMFLLSKDCQLKTNSYIVHTVILSYQITLINIVLKQDKIIFLGNDNFCDHTSFDIYFLKSANFNKKLF